jgi:rod shape-determining protein MreC
MPAARIVGGHEVVLTRSIIARTALLWLALELLAAWQVRAADGDPLLISWFRALVRPLVWGVQEAGNLTVDLVVGTGNLQHVIVENRRLKMELETLQARQLVLEQDLAAAREAQQLATIAAEFRATAVTARCTYRDLQRGTMEVRTAERVHLPRDVPAVAQGGLVGRVIRSAGRRHWLQLITHPAAAAAVQTPDATIQALVLGSGGPELSVAYVPRQARLERAAILITSGGDGIYPAGIPTARVVRLRETSEPFLEITAEPTASLDTLRAVVLLSDWSPRGNP